MDNTIVRTNFAALDPAPHVKIKLVDQKALDIIRWFCNDQPGRKPEPIKNTTQFGPELVAMVSQTIACACWNTLWIHHGHRPTTVLRGGKRTTGRLSDHHLNSHFRLRFTSNTYYVWTGVCHMWGEWQNATTSQEQSIRKSIRKNLRVRDSDNGDWLFFGLLFAKLSSMETTDFVRTDLRNRLALGSPLVALAGWMSFGYPTLDFKQHVGKLLEPGNVRLLECLSPWLLEHWKQSWKAIFDTTNYQHLPEKMASFAQKFHTYITILNTHQRLDLARPLVELTATLFSTDYPYSAFSLYQNVQKKGITPILERDRILDGFQPLLLLVQTLMDFARELSEERYHDPRYEEAQIYRQWVQKQLLPNAAQWKRAFSRALS
jgi:hypothetical protein